jgi:hypothetical protein
MGGEDQLLQLCNSLYKISSGNPAMNLGHDSENKIDLKECRWLRRKEGFGIGE